MVGGLAQAYLKRSLIGVGIGFSACVNQPGRGRVQVELQPPWLIWV